MIKLYSGKRVSRGTLLCAFKDAFASKLSQFFF